MAVERIKEFTINLGDIVQTRINSLVLARGRIQAKQEAEFQKIVSEQGMSYEDQLKYKADILSREKKKVFVDVEYVKSLKSNILSLRKLTRYEKVRKEYLDNYTGYKTSEITIDALINSIENQLTIVFDPDLRKELQGKLSEAKIERVNSQRQILENRVVLAKEDKSVEFLEKVISDVLIEHNKAVTLGNKEYSTSLDIYLQSLRSQKQKIVAETKRHDFDLKAASGAVEAVGKLDMLNGAIQAANATDLFVIDGDRYVSEREYWIFQRDSYLAGSGSGEFQSFFTNFNTEVKEKLDTISSTNRFGSIPVSTIAATDKGYKDFLSRNKFALYQGRIESNRITALTYAVDKAEKGVVEEADFQGEFTKGQTSLLALQNQFGIDLSTFVTDLKYRELDQPTRFSAIMKTAEFKAAQRLGISADDLDPVGNPEHKRLIDEEFVKITEAPLPAEGSILQNIEEKVVVPELEKKKTELETQKQVLETKVEATKPAPAPTPPAPAPTPTIPTGKEAIGKEVTIGGVLYPSQEWYDINVAKKATAPALVPPAPAPTPPAPAPAPVPEVPKLGTPIGRFPTTQSEITEFQQKFIFDKETKQWYNKPL